MQKFTGSIQGRQRLWLSTATVVAYLGLLGYTLALVVALGRVLVMAESRVSAYLPLLGYVACYPLVYIAAAWVFYYGLGAHRPRP